MNVFYPYKTIRGDIELRISDGKLDGGDFPKNPFTPDQRLMQLYDLDKKNWERVTLELELVGPADEIAAIEKAGGEVGATVVAHCTATQLRQTIPLQRAGGKAAKWHGTAELDHDNFRGRVEISGLIVGTAAGRPYRHLGRSEPWSIHFDEPAVLPLEGTLRVQWIDFKNPGEQGFLRDHADKPSFSDLSDSVPTVYLNKCDDFAGLPAVLDDRRRSNKWDKALHDAQRVGIARSVWLAMFNASLAAVREEEDGGDPDWPIEDWKRQVLQALLSEIYPDVSPEQALVQAVADRKTPDGAATLESRAEAAINAQVGAGKLLRRTLDALANAEMPAD